MFSIRITFFVKTFFIITSFSFISIIEKKLIANKVVVTRRKIKKKRTKKVGISNYVLDSSINLLNIWNESIPKRNTLKKLKTNTNFKLALTFIDLFIS